MRRGMAPKDACLEALQRITSQHDREAAAQCQGAPNFGLNFYCLNAKGEYAGVSIYESTYAVCTEKGAQFLDCEAVFPGRPEPA